MTLVSGKPLGGMTRMHMQGNESHTNDDARQGVDVLQWGCSLTQLKPISTRVSAMHVSAWPKETLLCTMASQEDQCSYSVGCETPKAKMCKIPELLECPSAPRKRRSVSRHSTFSGVSFFNPPDLDLCFAQD
ncbi:hypothetical protein O6H91_01G109200 [Diphasiastrum complanatum]|uniref:Uncharacterized protein n=1 Tax=Diphasiastrum complanatum TaxID=34168 RepID=A0ACC2EUM9_DIPCM|nr:hypothetical protein O6H91_01G109200 [Diphasiastrum complanatum]